MRVARFSATDASPRFGIVDEDELVVLDGDPMFSGFETTDERIPLADVRLLSPVIPRSKIVAIGLNYPAHAADMPFGAPPNPLIILKPNTAVVGPEDAIQIPDGVGKVVHEGELGIVIGRIAKDVSEDEALDYVFGYTIGNDVSARDNMAEDGQFARAKGYDTFCPLGPWIETELDPDDLAIQTWVDGERRRSGRTSDQVHSAAKVVSFVSSVMTLLPGDVVLMGTPAGSGQILPGQRVEIEIEGIGKLTNPVVDKPARA